MEGGSLKALISSGDRDAFVFNFAKGLLLDLTITGERTYAIFRRLTHFLN